MLTDIFISSEERIFCGVEFKPVTKASKLTTNESFSEPKSLFSVSGTKVTPSESKTNHFLKGKPNHESMNLLMVSIWFPKFVFVLQIGRSPHWRCYTEEPSSSSSPSWWPWSPCARAAEGVSTDPSPSCCSLQVTEMRTRSTHSFLIGWLFMRRVSL